MAGIRVVTENTTSTSIELEVYGLKESHIEGRYFYWYIDTSYDNLKSRYDKDKSLSDTEVTYCDKIDQHFYGQTYPSTQPCIFNGLKPNTTYYLGCLVISLAYDRVYLEGVFSETTAAPSRPSNWNWESTIASGKEIELKASEWNNFCGRINDFRSYKNMNTFSFTYVYAGRTQISAAIVNQARTAISGISGHGSAYLPPAAVSGETLISASFFNGLKDALNAIT